MAVRTVPASLPVLEQGLYWITELITIIYMLYSLYCASENAWRHNEPIKIEEGWTVIGRPKDTADYEWEFWYLFLWEVLPWLCGHAVMCQILTCFNLSQKMKRFCLTFLDALAVSYLLGFYTVAFLCIHPVVLYLVSKLGNTKVVWVTTLFFLTILNYCETALAHWFIEYKTRENFDAWFYMFVFVWANICQRATGFALECAWVSKSMKSLRTASPTPSADSMEKDSSPAEKDCESEGTDESLYNLFGWPTLTEIPSWLDMFFYLFYLPLFFTGPLMIYNNFHWQTRHLLPCTKGRLMDVMLKLVRIMFWAVVNVIILHYIYAHAINSNSKVLAKQSRWTLAATGYFLGQFFMMKYLVLFGFPAQLARLDGYEPPAVPACISYIYCYSDMWKFFDRGLYDFMKRYIFIPFGGSRAGLYRQVMGSVLCFAYVFYWHGAEYYLFLWCILNFVETSLEQLGAWSENTAVVRRVLYDKLTPAGIRRVRAVMSVPVFLMSVFAIFYFFGGTDAGLIFLQKLLTDIPWGSFCLFVLLVYCAIQNAMEVERLGMTKLKLHAHQD